jgi:protoheme IX farnesyltransferase
VKHAGSTTSDAGPSALADWATLIRPRIANFVALAALVGAMLAAGPGGSFALALEAALWITLTAASSSIFNQVLERDTDALMDRTSERPIVAGRVSARAAVLAGALVGAVGVTALALRFNALSALLALSTLCAYALVYTPLKRLSTLNTVIGAIPGAMPPVLGAVALAGAPGPWGWALFAILFAWQFPHFMAIAWLYREDYARAGMRMIPSVPGSEGLAGKQALAYSLSLLAISLLPAANGLAGVVYTSAAVVLGLVYVISSLAFARRETRTSARAVLFASLAYLPLLLAAILFDPVVASSHQLPLN